MCRRLRSPEASATAVIVCRPRQWTQPVTMAQKFRKLGAPKHVWKLSRKGQNVSGKMRFNRKISFQWSLDNNHLSITIFLCQAVPSGQPDLLMGPPRKLRNSRLGARARQERPVEQLILRRQLVELERFLVELEHGLHAFRRGAAVGLPDRVLLELLEQLRRQVGLHLELLLHHAHEGVLIRVGALRRLD